LAKGGWIRPQGLYHNFKIPKKWSL